MDEQAFKETWRELNERPCAFGKALLLRCAGCSRARKVLLAEREAMACLSPASSSRCGGLLDLLRRKSLFALHLPHLEGPLPHSKEMKVQCGGLLGLARAAGREGAPEDVEGLIQGLLEKYENLEYLPFGEIVKSVATFSPRPRGR